MNLARNEDFLTDKEKLLETFQQKIGEGNIRLEVENLEKQEKSLRRRLDLLMEKLEQELIEDEDFRRRYQKIKRDLLAIEDEQARLGDLSRTGQVSYENLKTSLEEIASFGYRWEFLSDTARAVKIRTIVREIRATKDDAIMDLYLDDIGELPDVGLHTCHPHIPVR
jgi:site-specific DNA recombinase